jgi:Lon protease-like protein
MRKDLPARPSIEHLKSQAKDLLDAYHRKDPDAFIRFRESLPAAHGLDNAKLVGASFALHDAHSVVAREYGFASFEELRAHVESLALRSLMAAHPNAPLPEQVIEAMSEAASSKPKPRAISTATSMPVVPLRGALLVAGALAPINVGRASSIAAADAARRAGGLLAVFSQKEATNETPSRTDLHPVGCIGQIISTVEGDPYGTFIVLRGAQWITLEGIEQTEPYIIARVAPFDVHLDDAAEVGRLEHVLREKVNALATTLPGGERIRAMIDKMNALELADATIANLPCSVDDKARYAGEPSVVARLKHVLTLVGGGA